MVEFFKGEKSLVSLAGICSLIIPSILIDSKFAAIVLLLLILNVGWCLSIMLKGPDLSVGDLARYVLQQGEDALEEGDDVKGTTFLLVVPVLIVAGFGAGISLMALWIA